MTVPLRTPPAHPVSPPAGRAGRPAARACCQPSTGGASQRGGRGGATPALVACAPGPAPRPPLPLPLRGPPPPARYSWAGDARTAAVASATAAAFHSPKPATSSSPASSLLLPQRRPAPARQGHSGSRLDPRGLRARAGGGADPGAADAVSVRLPEVAAPFPG